jgi:hypothetical protein
VLVALQDVGVEKVFFDGKGTRSAVDDGGNTGGVAGNSGDGVLVGDGGVAERAKEALLEEWEALPRETREEYPDFIEQLDNHTLYHPSRRTGMVHIHPPWRGRRESDVVGTAVPLRQGAALMYDSRLTHRGGRNDCRHRPQTTGIRLVTSSHGPYQLSSTECVLTIRPTRVVTPSQGVTAWYLHGPLLILAFVDVF